MTTSARDEDCQTVLRLHCPHHPEDSLIDIFVIPGMPPFFWWMFARRELGDAGVEGQMWEGSYTPAHMRPPNISVQRIVGPSLIGRPGPWENTWLMDQPEDIEWDEVRGVGHRKRHDVHYDPDTRKPHVRYEIRCLRQSCPYTATVTRPSLFKVLEWVLDNRTSFARQLALIQPLGQGSTWSISRPVRILTAPRNPRGFAQHDFSYWEGQEPFLINVEWDGLQRLLTPPK